MIKNVFSIILEEIKFMSFTRNDIWLVVQCNVTIWGCNVGIGEGGNPGVHGMRRTAAVIPW